MHEFYIGLMSGTSADGIDAALVDFSTATPVLQAKLYTPYPETLRAEIKALCQSGEINQLGALDYKLGLAFAQAAQQLITTHGIPANYIKAIGSHGQTVRHQPNGDNRFTLQIGDPNIIAIQTGITTVADFRRKDMALGGQGAPLVPAFHQAVFSSVESTRIIVNIGGIANITLLDGRRPETTLGFDTGPGNVLLDQWSKKHLGKDYDSQGEWAASGTVDADLLEYLLSDDYFQRPPPKSTGQEYFNLAWLETAISKVKHAIKAVDVQSTLVELTARSILLSIRQHVLQGDIFICGGGSHNAFLLTKIKAAAEPQFKVSTTDAVGIEADWVEAMAFAWLARETIHHRAGNLPQVTGARRAVTLGGVYYAN